MNVRARWSRWGPRCMWAAGTARQLPADTLGFRCGTSLFVSLLIELLMPHLSTSLKQSFRDTFGNPSLCGLSGLVSICGEGELACLGHREKWVLQKPRYPWFPGGVSGNPDPSQNASVSAGSSRWNVGGHLAKSLVSISDSQISENALAKRDQETHCKHKGQWQANNYQACW